MRILSEKKYKNMKLNYELLSVDFDELLKKHYMITNELGLAKEDNLRLIKHIEDKNLEIENLKKELKILKAKLTKEINKNKKGE